MSDPAINPIRIQRSQLQQIIGDDEDAIRQFELLFERAAASSWPVGSYYTQYPAAKDNDPAVAFPSSEEPGTLFGGTWVEQFADEPTLFFRTVGNETTIRDNGRLNGRQEDAMQAHGPLINAAGGTASNFLQTQSTNNGHYANTYYTRNNVYTDLRSAANTSISARTATETRSTNRLVKIWKRTA